MTYDPTSRYVRQDIEGWSVLVHGSLLDAKRELGQRVLKLLGTRLYEVCRTVPEAAVARLTEVAFWVEADNPEVIGACYHPSREWLGAHDFNPEKAKSIEIGNATNFLNWSLHQPSMVLHELAHAYHHQVLGYDHPGIRAAYGRAVEEKLYESVLRYDGKRARAYALNNDQEYFAELTEAYFGTNDFYPFVRAEVMAHDARMYEVLTEVWNAWD